MTTGADSETRSDTSRIETEPVEPALDVSVIVPLLDEVESLEPLYHKIVEALEARGYLFEVIFVDDGSTDGSIRVLESLADADPRVRVVSFRRNYGKSAALAEGFQRASGRWVATCDADLQDDPAEFPGMFDMLEAGADLVSGWKQKRRDPWTKRLPSKVFNGVVRRVGGVDLNDMNCGLKVYRREVVEALPVYGEFHRFLPLLAAWDGFKVEEKVVRHEPRKFGRSKFGSSRFVNGFLDLLSVMFLTMGQTSPLHLFGRIALVLLSVGMAINVWMLGIWAVHGGALRSRPLLILGLVLVVLGVQFISIGLLGEMVAYHNRRRSYGIRREIR